MKFKEMNGLFPDKTRKYIKGLCQILKERRFDLIKIPTRRKTYLCYNGRSKDRDFWSQHVKFHSGLLPREHNKITKNRLLKTNTLGGGID